VIGIRESLELALLVLKDWRVIATTLAVILAWSILRYVGLVYRRPRLPSPAGLRAKAAAKAATAKAPAASSEEEEVE